MAKEQKEIDLKYKVKEYLVLLLIFFATNIFAATTNTDSNAAAPTATPARKWKKVGHSRYEPEDGKAFTKWVQQGGKWVKETANGTLANSASSAITPVASTPTAEETKTTSSGTTASSSVATGAATNATKTSTSAIINISTTSQLAKKLAQKAATKAKGNGVATSAGSTPETAASPITSSGGEPSEALPDSTDAHVNANASSPDTSSVQAATTAPTGPTKSSVANISALSGLAKKLRAKGNKRGVAAAPGGAEGINVSHTSTMTDHTVVSPVNAEEPSDKTTSKAIVLDEGAGKHKDKDKGAEATTATASVNVDAPTEKEDNATGKRRHDKRKDDRKVQNDTTADTATTEERFSMARASAEELVSRLRKNPELRKKLDEAATQLKAVKKDHSDAQTTLEAAEREYERLKGGADVEAFKAAEVAYNAAAAQSKRVNMDLIAKQAEYEKLLQDTETMKQSRIREHKEALILRTKIEKKLKESESKFRTLETQFAKLLANTTASNKEISALEAKVKEAYKQLRKMEDNFEKAKQRVVVTKLQAETVLERHTREKNTIQEQLSILKLRLEDKNLKNQKTIHDLQTEVKALEEELAIQEKELQNAQKRKDMQELDVAAVAFDPEDLDDADVVEFEMATAAERAAVLKNKVKLIEEYQASKSEKAKAEQALIEEIQKYLITQDGKKDKQPKGDLRGLEKAHLKLIQSVLLESQNKKQYDIAMRQSETTKERCLRVFRECHTLSKSLEKTMQVELKILADTKAKLKEEQSNAAGNPESIAFVQALVDHMQEEVARTGSDKTATFKALQIAKEKAAPYLSHKKLKKAKQGKMVNQTGSKEGSSSKKRRKGQGIEETVEVQDGVTAEDTESDNTEPEHVEEADDSIANEEEENPFGAEQQPNGELVQDEEGQGATPIVGPTAPEHIEEAPTGIINEGSSDGSADHNMPASEGGEDVGEQDGGRNFDSGSRSEDSSREDNAGHGPSHGSGEEENQNFDNPVGVTPNPFEHGGGGAASEETDAFDNGDKSTNNGDEGGGGNEDFGRDGDENPEDDFNAMAADVSAQTNLNEYQDNAFNEDHLLPPPEESEGAENGEQKPADDSHDSSLGDDGSTHASIDGAQKEADVAAAQLSEAQESGDRKAIADAEIAKELADTKVAQAQVSQSPYGNKISPKEQNGWENNYGKDLFDPSLRAGERGGIFSAKGATSEMVNDIVFDPLNGPNRLSGELQILERPRIVATELPMSTSATAKLNPDFGAIPSDTGLEALGT